MFSKPISFSQTSSRDTYNSIETHKNVFFFFKPLILTAHSVLVFIDFPYFALFTSLSFQFLESLVIRFQRFILLLQLFSLLKEIRVCLGDAIFHLKSIHLKSLYFTFLLSDFRLEVVVLCFQHFDLCFQIFKLLKEICVCVWYFLAKSLSFYSEENRLSSAFSLLHSLFGNSSDLIFEERFLLIGFLHILPK